MAGLTHVVEHRAVQYRRTFRSSVFTSFLSPLLFLTAMGIGLGGYVDASADAALGGSDLPPVPRARACSSRRSMQSAAFEATFPIIGGLNWQRTFHAMYATPLSPRDIALGNLALDGGPAGDDRVGLHDHRRRCSGRPTRRRSCSGSRSRS